MIINIIKSAISLILALTIVACSNQSRNEIAHETDQEPTGQNVIATTTDATETTVPVDTQNNFEINTNEQNTTPNDDVPESTEPLKPTDSTQTTKPNQDHGTQHPNNDDGDVHKPDDNATTKPNSGSSNPQDESSKPSPTQKPSTDKPSTEAPPTEKPNQDTTTTNPSSTTEPSTGGNNEPYDGDTAVPDDVYNPPKQCDSHNMSLVNSTIDSEYELFSYVTKTFKCTNCSYTESRIDIESNKLSSAELRRVSNNIVNKVNSLRSSNGLNTLSTSSDWNAWADMRAKELSQVYGHSRPGGGSWMTAIGNTYTLAENVASGQSSGSAFFNAFSNSSSHRSNMMSPHATMIAVGIYVAENGTAYCAMILISQ